MAASGWVVMRPLRPAVALEALGRDVVHVDVRAGRDVGRREADDLPVLADRARRSAIDRVLTLWPYGTSSMSGSGPAGAEIVVPAGNDWRATAMSSRG